MRSAVLCVAAMAVMGAFAGSPLAAADPVAKLTAYAINMSNIGGGGSSTVYITIDRWSTDAERDSLRTVFVEKGPEKLLTTLQKLPRIGFMRLPNRLGYDLHFARETSLDEGGRRILVATDRPIGFEEARSRPRTIDYPFTLVEIRLKRDGTGEGKMSLATKISLNQKERVLELENYSSEPVRLTNVKADK
jgi:hypothetical protein